MTNEIEIVYPAGDAAIMLEEVRKIRKEKAESIDRIKTNAAAITESNYRAEKLNAFDGEDKRFKAVADAIADKAAVATHTKEILIEIAASRKEITAELKAREKIIRDFKAKCEPPEPVHTYIMQMEITDGDLKKVVAAVTKCGARFRVAEATKDKDMKWAERFFAEMI